MGTPEEQARMRVRMAQQWAANHHPSRSDVPWCGQGVPKPGWPVFQPFTLTRDDVHFLQATGIKPE
jgi:hypothetical protein